MKIEINPSGFNSISTAVFYRCPMDISIEDNIETYSAYKVKYKGSDNSFTLNTFTEYDFKYWIEKFKFDDKLILDLYSKDSVNLLSVDTLNKYSPYLIPTCFSTEEGYDQYFSSAVVNDKQIILLDAPGEKTGLMGVWRIEFYEEELLEGNIGDNFYLWDSLLKRGLTSEAKAEPVMILTLGPTEEMTERRDILKAQEEITNDKIIIISVSQSTYNTEVNLSYKAWNNSENPNRWVNTMFLRNDEFYSTAQVLKCIEKSTRDSNLWMDRRSGTIVGNHINSPSQTPILSHRLNILDSLNSQIPIYSPYHCYSSGDIVLFNGVKWESLVDYNLGNTPEVSYKWGEVGRIKNNILTSRISVEIENEKGGQVLPGDEVTIENSSSVFEFEVVENLGWELSKTTPAYSEPGKYLGTSDYIVSEKIDQESGRIIKTITIKNWTLPLESNRVVFVFDETGCRINLSIRYKGTIYNYPSWAGIFEENVLDLNLEKIYITQEGSDKVYPFKSSGGVAQSEGVSVGESITLHFPDLVKYQVVGLTLENTTEDKVDWKELTPELKGDEYHFQTVSDFGAGNWTIDFITRLLTITAIGSSSFEFSKPQGQVEYDTTSYSLEFYNRDSKKDNTSWTVDINGKIIELGNTVFVSDTCSVTYSYNSYRDIYSLTWSGKIREDYIIRINEI